MLNWHTYLEEAGKLDNWNPVADLGVNKPVLRGSSNPWNYCLGKERGAIPSLHSGLSYREAQEVATGN